MKRNVGKTDRAIRVIIGIALLSLLFILDGPVRWVGLIGIAPIIIGLSRRCPLFSLLNISSCPAEERAAG